MTSPFMQYFERGCSSHAANLNYHIVSKVWTYSGQSGVFKLISESKWEEKLGYNTCVTVHVWCLQSAVRHHKVLVFLGSTWASLLWFLSCTDKRPFWISNFCGLHLISTGKPTMIKVSIEFWSMERGSWQFYNEVKFRSSIPQPT